LQGVMQPYVAQMEGQLAAVMAESSATQNAQEQEEAKAKIREEHGLLMDQLRQSNDSPKAIPAVVTVDGEFIAIQTQTNMGNPILYFGRLENGVVDIKHTHVSDGKELTTHLTGKIGQVGNRPQISGDWSLTADSQAAAFSGTWSLQKERSSPLRNL
jgi:hypothetical protein